jgi:hypothetical protein
MRNKWHGGKGSAPRPVDKKKFDENWERIFGKKDSNKDTKPE